MRVTDTPLRVAGRTYQSRLFLGTGKYVDLDTMDAALAASGTECVTVAVRRVDLCASGEESLLERLAPYEILPNTAGCFDADSAVRTAQLAREALDTDLIKLEVLTDPETLRPERSATLDAARRLVADGFQVLVYTLDDPDTALELDSLGVASVMPLGSSIGSGRGILKPEAIQEIVEGCQAPVIVDAGVGTASDVSVAFELGAEGVLLNTGVACADDPVRMAAAVRHAALAGRDAFLAGRIPRAGTASATSPTTGVVGSGASSA